MLCAFIGMVAFATADGAAYDLNKAKAEASRFVQEQKALFNTLIGTADQVTGALGLSRFYQVGDSWRVAARYINHGSTRKTAEPSALRDTFTEASYFDFRVSRLENSGAEARIEVTPVTKDGQPLGKRLVGATITVNRDMKILKKEIKYSDLSQPIVAEFGGARNINMGFEALPIELPDFEGARKITHALSASGASPFLTRAFDPAITIRFETSDMFGRVVHTTWQRGDLWPTAIENNSGHFALVSQKPALANSEAPTPTPPGNCSARDENSGAGGCTHDHPTVREYWDETNLASLMKKYAKGTPNPSPWAGYWWPYTEGGINDRTEDASGLSPADKLDAVFGNNQWISSWEHSNHGLGRGAADWFGHCNGWATAAIMESEPRAAKQIGSTRFGVGDRKAILSEYWLESGSDFVGTRVWNRGDVSSYAFWDVIPAQFHLMMANLVGRQKRSLIVDRFTGDEVWNQPVVAYEFKPIHSKDYLGRDPEYSNLYRVNVTADLWWANDDVEPDDVTPKFDWKDGDFFTHRQLKYELWVDEPLEFNAKDELVSSGNIIVTNNGYGGSWKNGTSYEVLIDSHPDFLWVPLSYSSSSGYKNPRINDDWVQQNITN